MPVDGVYGRFFTLNPENGEIGIFLHEIGHLLGLPDLYDTDGGSAGIGQWSMMSGGWTLDGARTPADFDAWSKIQLGFADVKRIFLNRADEVILPTVFLGSGVPALGQRGRNAGVLPPRESPPHRARHPAPE